jgi:tellurite resistance protein TerB
VTGSALVSLADGVIKPEEKSAMANYLRISEELKVFNGQEIVDEFNKAVSLFEFDFTLGKTEALKRIAKIKNNEGAARTLVRVCISLANSDNDFDPKEKEIITLIAKELGLNPSEFLG